MSEIVTYQGGLTPIYTRAPLGQRGSGFFSSLQRFLVPIGKAILPSLFRGANDLLSGKSVGETLKSRGVEAGKNALGALTSVAMGKPSPTASTRPSAKMQRPKNRYQRGKGGLPPPPPPSPPPADNSMEWQDTYVLLPAQKGYKRRVTSEADQQNNFIWK